MEDSSLASWADGAENGLILFSMGSMISEMHESKTQMFVNALNRVPMRVIWRFSGKLPDNVGENIRAMDWFPQNDLMGHRNTKLFISHGGNFFLDNNVNKIDGKGPKSGDNNAANFLGSQKLYLTPTLAV